MATMQFTFDDGVAERIYTAFALNNGYQTSIEDPENPGTMIENPQTVEQFTHDCVSKYITNQVATYESQQAAQTAAQNAIDAVNNEIVIT